MVREIPVAGDDDLGIGHPCDGKRFGSSMRPPPANLRQATISNSS
jgi:hypothetical protein